MAIQTWVARRAGIDVRRVELMHLNTDFRHPDRGELFARTDVTAEVEAFQPRIAAMIEEQLAALAGADAGGAGRHPLLDDRPRVSLLGPLLPHR